MRAGSPWNCTRVARETNPSRQRLVVRKHLEDRAVGGGDVLWIAGERRPAEGPLAFAEERSNVLGHEARDVERIRDARLHGLAPDVVAVIEDDAAAALQRQHGLDVPSHRGNASRDVALGITGAEREGRLQ